MLLRFNRSFLIAEWLLKYRLILLISQCVLVVSLFLAVCRLKNNFDGSDDVVVEVERYSTGTSSTYVASFSMNWLFCNV